jgi:hypothetical protein
MVIKMLGFTHASGEPNYSGMYSLTKVRDKTIKTYVTHQLPQKEKLLAICAGLRIHSEVAKKLIEEAGININTAREIDFVYRSLIERHYNEGLDKWNEYLLEANQPTLP